MSKQTIIKRAANVRRRSNAEMDVPAQNRVSITRMGLEAPGGADADNLAVKIADALYAKFAPLILTAARLAAADTIHTVEQPETVFKRAVDEARRAANVIQTIEFAESRV